MRTNVSQMTQSFSLPFSDQEQYSKFYLTTIKKGALASYKIVWVGTPLSYRFKSETMKDKLTPSNIFIVKKKDKFEYCVIDNRNNCFKLPKKFYTLAFPNISLNSVPKDNKIDVQITESSKQTLPYIPNSFLEMKRLKTTRKRRRLTYVETPPETTTAEIQFKVSRIPSWHVLQLSENKDLLLKRQIVEKLRALIKQTDESTMVLNDPFESLHSIEELSNSNEFLQKFKIIASFISHYCRAELGLAHTADPPKISKGFVEALNP